MSIFLEKMSQEAYEQFWNSSFEHHVDELIREEHFSKEAAEEETRRELEEMLPQGQDTPDNYLLSINSDECVIGYLWFLTEMTEGTKQAFLCDFLIYEENRRRGYGKDALMELEKAVGDSGCAEIVLFVEAENKEALQLYLKRGYGILREHNYGYYMKKAIEAF